MTIEIKIPDNIKNILRRLENNNFEAYIAGGCVRDSILGVTPSDYDITTNALPDEMKTCFSGLEVIETGIKHGTLTVIADGEPVEVTTFRIDGEYSDNRRPDKVEFTSSLKDDLARRDFTVNAMAYSEKSGLVDIFGGRDDLERKIIRCVGTPAERFGEDALRILRALRFSSTLGFEIEEETAIAIRECRELLKNVSYERIFAETEKLILGKGCTEVLTAYGDVLGVVIPEILPCIGFEQHTPYHRYDVWEHTCVALGNSPRSMIVRLALLFHDIEKPSCLKIDSNGVGHFHGHGEKSAKTAENILRRLKCDTKTINIVSLLIEKHYGKPWIKNGRIDRTAVKFAMSEIGAENFLTLTEIQYADDTAKSDEAKKRLPLHEKTAETARKILACGECYSVPQLEINGRDVESTGLHGRAVGNKLREVLDLVIEEKLPNEREKLLDYLTNR